MMKIVVRLTNTQSEQFLAAIEVLDPVKGHEGFEDMTIGLIEEFCRDMGIGWASGKASEDKEQNQHG